MLPHISCSHVAAFPKPCGTAKNGTIPAEKGMMLLEMFDNAIKQIFERMDLKGMSMQTVLTPMKPRIIASPRYRDGMEHVGRV